MTPILERYVIGFVVGIPVGAALVLVISKIIGACL